MRQQLLFSNLVSYLERKCKKFTTMKHVKVIINLIEKERQKIFESNINYGSV